MNDQSEGTIVLELAGVVAELTRRHGELASCLRSLREDLRTTPATVGVHEPPPPRLLQPPPPAPAASPAPIPGGLTLPAVPDGAAAPVEHNGASVPSAPQLRPDSRETDSPPSEDLQAPRPQLFDTGGSSVPPHPLTKRHYDYFAELDDLLARLPVTPSAGTPKPPTDH